MTANWHLYVIRTGKGILYTGITTDVGRRLDQHARGAGAKALRGKGPLTLVFQCPAGDRRAALRWEYRIKQLNRRQKEQLIASGAQSLEAIWAKLRVEPCPAKAIPLKNSPDRKVRQNQSGH
ncbi:GIY-YIG nuclease family protein [Martelella alba]|uniref:GIY-YIG nuclease family protein n=1 Tax=Martelella alba TaxID=2590451 RepID=A0ABY2SRW5_9HYPH|nr:GIY-YIG nuclease family protein [Martelella alba]TKI08620.1 GIY-YIG nuclease family protein [Martelella alba]